MVGMPNRRGLNPDPVFDPLDVNMPDKDSAAEHDWNASLVRRDPHRGFVQSLRVTLLYKVFDPWHDLEGIDAARSDLDFLAPLHFQIEQIAVLSPENVEVEMVANLKILTPGKIDRRDRIHYIGWLIEFVFFDLSPFITMDEPLLCGTIETGLGVDDLLVFPLTESEPRRRKRLGLDGRRDGIAHLPK